MGLKQTRLYCIEQLKFQPSSKFKKRGFRDLDDKILVEVFRKRLGCIETCAKDMFSVIRRLLYIVLSAHRCTQGKTISCTNHKTPSDFSFLSKCQKCSTVFNEMLGEIFYRNTRDGPVLVKKEAKDTALFVSDIDLGLLIDDVKDLNIFKS